MLRIDNHSNPQRGVYPLGYILHGFATPLLTAIPIGHPDDTRGSVLHAVKLLVERSACQLQRLHLDRVHLPMQRTVDVRTSPKTVADHWHRIGWPRTRVRVVPMSASGGDYGNAFQAAVPEGYEETVRLLLNNGAG
jgi:hypothetical protein